jgi:outer membrane protein assembly factor BamB
MSDKGTMIELKIDRRRITHTTPLHIVTPLSGALIAAPDDEAYAPAVAAVAERFNLKPPGEAFPFEPCHSLAGHTVAVGHCGNNGLLRRLYDMGYLLHEDFHAQTHRLRTVHNPFGDGHNVVAILGATPDVVVRGVEQLATHIRGHAIDHAINDIAPPPEVEDKPDAFLAKHKPETNVNVIGRPGPMIEALKHLNRTGDKRWADVFVQLMTPYAVGDIPLSFWQMSAVDFWTDVLAIEWEIAEPLDCFNDDDRLLMAQFIASCTEYCHDSITYQKWRITDEEHMVFNHYTFPAGGIFFGCRYLRHRGYAIGDLDAWEDKARRVFARAATAGRPFDEGGAGYTWLVGTHLIKYELAQGISDYARSEKMRHYADLAVSIFNNRLEPVPFGDCGAIHSRRPMGMTILSAAAQWHRDSGYRWILEKTAPDYAKRDLLTLDIPAKPPSEHVGVFILPLDPVIVRWANRPFFPGYPMPPRLTNVPAEQSFDKLTLRAGWDPDDDYLLLQGFGSGSHGHPDANAISQYQRRGRVLLHDSDYIRRMPKNHNGVMVIRDGKHDWIPLNAELIDAKETAFGAVTQSRLIDYNGCDWLRTIVWLRNDCVVVIDTLSAKTAGDYALRCYWRTLGEAELDGRTLHADHAGEHFHVIELTDSDRRLDIESPSPNSYEYAEYDFGDGRPKVMREQRDVAMRAGDTCTFINLLRPSGSAIEPDRMIHFTDDGGIEVDGAAVRIESDRVAVGDTTVTLAEPLTLRDSAAPAATPALAPASGKVVWQSTLDAPATCMRAMANGSLLVGCEDGVIAIVDGQGAVRELAKADERINAVAVEDVFGEVQPCLFATGRDKRMHWFNTDGTLRHIVALPDGSHLPGWGRAICTADLDSDGKQWPIVGTDAWRVHAVNPDGTLRWWFDTTAHSVTCVASGDLNGDGRDEVVAATIYFNLLGITADGQRLWEDEDYNDYWQAGPNFPFLCLGDIDGDGKIETLAGGEDTLIHCVDHLGVKKWTASIGDEAAGLELFAGGIAAASMTGDVHLVDGQGKTQWRTALGSPCTAMTLGDNAVVVATEDGAVTCIDASGKIIGRHQLDGAATLLQHVPGRGTVAATRDGRVVLITP